MVFDDNGIFVQSIPLGRMPTFMLVNNKQLHCANRIGSLDGSRELSIFLTIYNTTDWNFMDSVFVTGYFGLHFFPLFLSQSKQSVYFHYLDPQDRNVRDTLYVFENQKLTPYLTARVEDGGVVSKIVMTDNYGIITHAISVRDPDADYPRSVYSQYYFDLHSMKGRYATNGFIDDFYGNNDVIINPIPNTNLFYYYRENNDYSPDIRTTPNPTLYIGTFKE